MRLSHPIMLGWGFVKIIAINQYIHGESPQETEKGRKEKRMPNAGKQIIENIRRKDRLYFLSSLHPTKCPQNETQIFLNPRWWWVFVIVAFHCEETLRVLRIAFFQSLCTDA